METKKCNRCLKYKPVSEFNKDNRRKDGLFIYCRECQREIFREYYSLNKEKVKANKNLPKNKEKRKIYENTPQRKEHKKKVYREYYKKHREELLKKERAKLDKRYEFLEKEGLLTDCIICGFPKEKRNAIHFHHIDPKEKDTTIGLMIQRIKKYPDEVLIKEVKKCVCMCANCHMLYHGGDEEIIKKFNEVINNGITTISKRNS